MATVITPRVSLPPVPKAFTSDIEVWKFLEALRQRVGGDGGNLIYDAAQDGATAAALEPLVFAVTQEAQAALEGAVRSIIEQIQEQGIDISGLLTDTQPLAPQEQYYDEIPVAGIIQTAIDNGLVSSVFGRTGAVTATEGDYTLTQLGDVTITAPVANQILKYNGSAWVNSTGGSGSSPLTTKGDLYTFDTADARLGVGANGTVLTADSAEPTGLKWTAVGGTGTVTTLSVVSANGLAGTVSNPTTTPAITLTTSITGTLKGNGTAISAAAGSDLNTTFGSQAQNLMYSSPTGASGTPSFRAMERLDLPTTSGLPVLTYDAFDVLERIDYADGSYKEFVWVDGKVSTINNGVILKTFNYTGDLLTSITET